MQHRPIHFSLPEIVKLVSSGAMALPQFQRKFVWDPDKVTELLDSISNGWPIGSLLLLEGPQPFDIKEIQDGPVPVAERVKYYILDGQQRITSIFHALTNRSDVVYYVDLAAGAEDDLPEFKWARRGTPLPETAPGSSHLVASLLSEEYFREVVSNAPSATAGAFSEARRQRLGALLEDGYHVPGILMAQGIELEALTRIFETLNRTGVKLDAFDLMVAVLYPTGFHLRDSWEAASNEFDEFEQMDTSGLEILKLIALWRRDHDERSGRRSPRKVVGVRQRDVLNVPADYVIGRWDDAVAAYLQGLRFMVSEFGVLDGDSAPSSAMLLTLSYLLERGESDQQITKWYWRAVVDQRYGQGANTQVVSDVRRWPAMDHVSSELAPLLRINLLDPVRRNRILRYGIRGLLVARGALDPVSGKPLEGRLEDMAISEIAPPSAGDRKDTLTVDHLILRRGSAKKLRAIVAEERFDELHGVAFESQGFPKDPWRRSLNDCRERRIRLLTTWIEGLA